METKPEVKKEIKLPVKDEIKISKRVVLGSSIGVVILVIVLALVFLHPFSSSTDTTKPIVVATVNGQSIYDTDVKQAQEELQQRTGTTIDEGIALNQSIAKLILLEKAQSEGVAITPTEAETEIVTLLAKNNMTLATFKAQLVANKVDYDTTLKDYTEQMIIGQLLKAHIQESVVTENDIRAFYDKNKALFLSAAPGGTNTTGKTPSYASLAPQIKTMLQQQGTQAQVASYIDTLRAQADVKIL